MSRDNPTFDDLHKMQYVGGCLRWPDASVANPSPVLGIKDVLAIATKEVERLRNIPRKESNVVNASPDSES